MIKFFTLKNSSKLVKVISCSKHECECFKVLSKTYNEKAMSIESHDWYRRCFNSQLYKTRLIKRPITDFKSKHQVLPKYPL